MPLSVRRALPGRCILLVKKDLQRLGPVVTGFHTLQDGVEAGIRAEGAHRQQPDQQPKLAHIRLTQRRRETCKPT